MPHRPRCEIFALAELRAHPKWACDMSYWIGNVFGVNEFSRTTGPIGAAKLDVDGESEINIAGGVPTADSPVFQCAFAQCDGDVVSGDAELR